MQGGRSPPLNCLTHLNAAFHCKDQAAISEMVEQEQWGAEGVQPPLNHSHYIRYNFNAGCSAGSAPFFVIRRITPYLFFRVTSHFRHFLCVALSREEDQGREVDTPEKLSTPSRT